MPTLSNYDSFAGRHWETGTVQNFFAARNFKAPHTGEPYSEALLLGVSGGITVGYFNFSYKGYDPQCNILTRNTFGPWDTMLSRLGVAQNIEHTASPDRAENILSDTIAGGTPAIVWADMWSLPYNNLAHDEGMWGNFPIIVYGYEPDQGSVMIADRARTTLYTTTEDMARARSRIKKDKHRLMTLEAPDPAKLAGAVRLGICDTIKLFTEKPPKGSANNFGLKALHYWARMLRMPKQRNSWEKLFPAGNAMIAGLTSAYSFAFLFGKNKDLDAERKLYATFLEEAATILDNPNLREVANKYRQYSAEWRKLPALLLPDNVAGFGELRRLMTSRHEGFLEQADDALEEIKRIDLEIAELRQRLAADFPLSAEQVVVHREAIAAQLDAIYEVERESVTALQASGGF